MKISRAPCPSGSEGEQSNLEPPALLSRGGGNNYRLSPKKLIDYRTNHDHIPHAQSPDLEYRE